MSKRKEILLAGLGGQGVITAAVLVGQAAVADGQFAAGSNSYGAQARGSACKAEVVISQDTIDYPHAETPDILVAMSQGAYDAYAEELAEGGVVLYDSGLVTPRGLRKEVGFKVTALVLEQLGNKQVANVFWVGVAAGYTGWFSKEGLAKVVADTVPERFRELNLKALEQGLALGRSAKES
jgi:2-oxoglutarate ferredoxin oxidoreductase subunit gamma